MGAVLYVVGLFFIIFFSYIILNALESIDSTFKHRVTIDDIRGLDEIFHKTR